MSNTRYSINLDVRFGPLEPFDVQAIVDETTEEWFNQTLTQVNDCCRPPGRRLGRSTLATGALQRCR